MPKATKTEVSDYLLPAGDYFPAVLEDVEEIEIPYFRKDSAGNKTNEQATFVKWRWKFRIQGGEYDQILAYGDTRPEYTTRSDDMVRIWGEQLLGRELEIGEEFDTDKILGLPCMITVRHGDPRPKRDGTMFYPCEVDEVLPRSTNFTSEPPF